MKLAELGIDVDLMSLTPVKRSHSVCAQGGINSCNDQTRQEGDSEWKHLDDTVYGGDFLQHQPPVKEMAYWGPKIIDLMDRLGVPFNRTPEGFIDRRRFGGTLYKRTAFAGATTGQQLLYALDEQVRRWEARGQGQEVRVLGFPGPGAGRPRRLPRLRRPGPGDDGDPRLSGRRRGPGHRRLRPDLRPLDDVHGLHGQPPPAGPSRPACKYANAEFIQVHPTAIPGADKLRLMSESARGEGGRVWVPRKPQDPRDPRRDSRSRTLLLPGGPLPQVRQPGAARHRHARDLRHLRERGAERRTGPAVRVPGPDAHRSPAN